VKRIFSDVSKFSKILNGANGSLCMSRGLNIVIYDHQNHLQDCCYSVSWVFFYQGKIL